MKTLNIVVSDAGIEALRQLKVQLKCDNLSEVVDRTALLLHKQFKKGENETAKPHEENE